MQVAAERRFGVDMVAARRVIRRSPGRRALRPEPAGRIGQERLERELRGAEQRGVDAERRRDDPDERPGAPAGRAGRAPPRSTRRRTGRIRPNRPAEDDEPRVQDVDQAGQADRRASDRRGRAPRAAAGPPAAASRRTASTPGAAARRLAGPRGRAGAPSPTSVSQQPIDAAAAGRAVRVDRHVPDLAAVAGGARQRPAVDDRARRRRRPRPR